MRILLLLPLLLIFVSSNQNLATSADNSSVMVVGFKWSKARQAAEKMTVEDKAPAAAMIPQNKNYQRNVRINDPAGTRDPNLDTIDGRSAAMEKAVQESRTPQTKPVDGYAYQAKIKNASKKPIEILFWEYQFVDPSNSTLTRRQFLCGVKIMPDKEKELQGFSTSGPSEVVSVGSLTNKSQSPFQEKVVINRVEYSDGSIWQRRDWNFAEIRPAYARAIGTSWRPGEVCRGL